MTKKDFFRMIIKIFGLYSMISVLFSVLPNNIYFAFKNIDYYMLGWILGSLLIIVLMFIFLIFKPDIIINWFKLDKGFDEDIIDFKNFNSENILKLAIIVVGGILIIRFIPAFLNYSFFAIKAYLSVDLINYPNSISNFNWFISFINIILGYFMLTNYNSFAKILNEKNKTGA